jgi:hypothetical protein
MRQLIGKSAGRWLVLAAGITALPGLAFAQAASPFLTGATSLQSNILAWLTPVAVILVMVLGGMAMANRIIRDVGIGVDSTLESDDVGLDISPNQRVVVSVVVLIQPLLCLVVLSREAQVVGEWSNRLWRPISSRPAHGGS